MAYMNIMNRNKSYIIPLCIILLFSTIILCCSKADDEDIQEKTSGVHDLYLCFTNISGTVNFDWWQFK